MMACATQLVLQTEPSRYQPFCPTDRNEANQTKRFYWLQNFSASIDWLQIPQPLKIVLKIKLPKLKLPIKSFSEIQVNIVKVIIGQNHGL